MPRPRALRPVALRPVAARPFAPRPRPVRPRSARRLLAVLAAATLAACSAAGTAADPQPGGSAGTPSAGTPAAGAPGSGAPGSGSGTTGTTGTTGPGPSASASPSPSPAPLAQLPHGGRSIFPAHVVVMSYGTARTPTLGVLGEGTPDQAAKALTARAKPFQAASGRPVLPAFELITTIAQRSPGADGTYSGLVADADVQRYLDAARKAGMMLVLDFQPGRADVLAQVKRYERFLLQPEVGIALDPEWALKPGQRPGRQIGTMDAATINRVSAYLSELTTRNRLPEKLFIVHQFQKRMLPDRQKVVDRPGLALVFHVDGFGPQSQKKDTYDVLATRDGRAPGGRAHNGFKLFLDEDTDLMTPAEAMALVPRPELLSYQ